MIFPKTNNNRSNDVSPFSFLRRNNKSRRGRGWLGVPMRTAATVCFLTILILVFSLQHSPVSGFLWNILTPVAGMRDWTAQSVASVGGSFQNNEALVNENNLLRGQLQEAQQKVIDRDSIYQENLVLKTQYSRADAETQHPVLAGIIARPPQLPYDMLMIDAGTNHGLRVGDMVSVGSAVIGTISETYPAMARVEVFSSAGEEINGMLNGVAITAEGQGSGAMLVRLPAGVAVSVGDSISLSAASGGVFGIVTQVDAPTSSAIKTVYIKLPVDLFSLKFVMVDTDTNHVFINYIPVLASTLGTPKVTNTATTSEVVIVATSTTNAPGSSKASGQNSQKHNKKKN